MNGWGRNSSHGKLLREAVNACKMAWESCVLSSCMQHGERVLKAVGQPSHQTQVCRTAFSVAQHSSSRCSAGEVPGNSVTQYTPGRNAFQDQEQARGSVFFKALTLGDTRALTGSPAQPAPLSSTSYPGSTVTAARSPVGEHCLPSAEPGVQWVTTQAVRALSQQLSQVTKKVCGYLHAVFPKWFSFLLTGFGK